MSCFKTFFISVSVVLALSIKAVSAKDPSKIVAAKVNEYVITAQDVLNALNKLPQKIKDKPLSDIYPNIVNELINQYLITKQAYKDKLDLDKNVIIEIKKNKDEIVARNWIRKFLSKNISNENIKNFYDNYFNSFKSLKEFNASHILVKDENEAMEIIKQLKNKEEFSQLAKKHSIGPSGKNEGKLGWFKSGQMVKEFEEAIFTLKTGTITETPVKTKFGYHIIKLNDTRNSQPKKLDEIKQKIVQQIKKTSLAKLVKEIRKNQKISIVKFKDVAKEVNN